MRSQLIIWRRLTGGCVSFLCVFLYVIAVRVGFIYSVQVFITSFFFFFFFQAEDGIRDLIVTGVQTCALPISFSKIYGLAGLRIGYVVTSPDVALHLAERGLRFGVGAVSAAAAAAALDDSE